MKHAGIKIYENVKNGVYIGMNFDNKLYLI